MRGIKSKIPFSFFLIGMLVPAFGNVTLPKLVSDGMVLQRDAEVKIWGWALAGEKISVRFLDSEYSVTTDSNGAWTILLSNLKEGGPYDMRIQGDNVMTIHDILVGDVWVCSGQSNMGVSLAAVSALYPEIQTLDEPFIRQFSTFPGTNFVECEKDFRFGRWQHADSVNVRRFTAVGYFFAKTLYEKYHVPIGLINSNMGGSSAEAWISEESIKSFPLYYEQLQMFKDPAYIEKIKQQDDERFKAWFAGIRRTDAGLKGPQTWADPDTDTSDWETMHVPQYWTDTKLGLMNGVVWFRKDITIPAGMTGKPGALKLGRIFDVDSVYINGKFIGTTGSQYAPRNYQIPADLLHAGENTLVVRDISQIRHGGFVPGKEYALTVGDETINLEGDWKYKIGTVAEPLEDRLFTGKIPSGLFNSGIAPILNYRIKGALWYQGESNTSRAFEHYELFKLLIKDWRRNWNQGDFPFLFVQLPNFEEVNEERTKTDWAYFRGSQLKALAIPNTGMAVTIDAGEFNDIHPLRKKPVGERLALAAQKVVYGDDLVYSGPVYQSMQIKGNKIILTFSHTGSGLIAKGDGNLNCFEICGSDNKYFPAEAKIEKGRIIVRSKQVSVPAAARYAWANNPEGANLYNKEGLPASPFRTSELY